MVMSAIKRKTSVSDDSDGGCGDVSDSETVGRVLSSSSNSNNNNSNSDRIRVEDEYADDSSDEEDVVNTIGDVPLRWYDEFDHVGYSRDGARIGRAGGAQQRDHIDQFLERVGNPEFWRTVVDKSTGEERTLSDQDLQLIDRVMRGGYPSGSAVEQSRPVWLDYFSGITQQTPVTARPEHKRSFLPSRSEALKVAELVGKMRRGLIRVSRPTDDEEAEKRKAASRQRYYMLWKEDGTTDEMRRLVRPQPAPRPPLPGHELSYRPPPEYLPLEGEEQQQQQAGEGEGEEGPVASIVKSYRNLRSVPAYSGLVGELFERCLSLYLCPRKTVVRTQLTGPEQMLPPLPDRRDLQPYPTHCALVYRGHRNAVRSLSVSSDGQLLASGSDDGCVRVWELATTRCLQTCRLAPTAADTESHTADDTAQQQQQQQEQLLQPGVSAVAWNPSSRLQLVAAACGRHVYLIAVVAGNAAAAATTAAVLANRPAVTDAAAGETHARRYDCRWRLERDEQRRAGGVLVALTLVGVCRQLDWHAAGDYFVSVVPDAGNTSVMVHQLSRWRSQMPFSRVQRAQAARFHPLRPYLFIATMNHVRVFNLAQRRLAKKLSVGVKWCSSLALHPAGDNLVVGSYDHRVHWLDLDLSPRPCHRLRCHGQAVRQVAFHKRYPLLSSAGDDTKLMVFHAKVSSDLSQVAQVVPVKMLRGHDKCEELCVLDVTWHPDQPWLLSAGADGTIRLWV